MSHESTIPSRLDPMQTVPAPLSGEPRARRTTGGEGGFVRWTLLAAAVVALFAAASHFVP